MAKAVLPLRTLVAGEAQAAGACEERIVQRFLRALGQNGKA
jgi:hypothetical protein